MPIDYKMEDIDEVKITPDNVSIKLKGDEESEEGLQPEGEMKAPEGEGEEEETIEETTEEYPMPPADSLATDAVSFTIDEDSITTTESGSLVISDVPIAKAMVQFYEDTEGGVLKTPDEIKAMAPFLNGTFITDGHPDKNRAKREDIQGEARNPTFSDNTAFVDIEVTGDSLVKDILDGKKRQVSIGFSLNPLISDEGEFEGAKYLWRQDGILVDHIAIVEKGRCSLNDGCGISEDILKGAKKAADEAKATKAKLKTEMAKREADKKVVTDSVAEIAGLKKELKEFKEMMADSVGATDIKTSKDSKDKSNLTGAQMIDNAYDNAGQE